MSNDTKRMILLVTACVVWIWSANFLMDRLGFFPKAKPKPAVVEQVKDVPAADAAKDAEAEPGKDKAPPALAASKVQPVNPDELVLGSVNDKDGYDLRVQMSQLGGGVDMIELAAHEAERVENRKDRRPLRLVSGSDSSLVPSYALDHVTIRDAAAGNDDKGQTVALGTHLWEVVRDDKGRAVRPVLDDASKAEIGQEIVFRLPLGDHALVITKTFRLRKGYVGMEMKLAFDSGGESRRVSYELLGPHGLPIEGEWYTAMFREVFFGLAKGDAAQVETRLASDVVKKAESNSPEIFETLPIKYAGVENQYFASFFAPDPPPASDKTRIDAQTHAIIVGDVPKDKQKADVSVALTSSEFVVAPNRPTVQAFKIFAGPKTTEALAPFGAVDLAAYRKSGWFAIPYASTLAQNVISPLLGQIYGLTDRVARVFGRHGNYGVAIILLTFTVRLLLFPLSRKQAISAKRMQDLQPKMAELKEKYKDDKEAFAREQFALFRQYKVNPFGGCLLGLIQLPIFVGLWQALNNSVALRHASFLWIDNLAAPDMLFKFPVELPILGNYFNLLPFAVVGLMLVQMKLFSPPATTPDQEMTQKMMKVMMVFMSFMFYKVPSGLGIYFITSSSWAICERLLLPKMVRNEPVEPEADPGDGKGAARPKPGPNGNGNGDGNPPKPGGFRARLQQLIEEANNDRTHRNNDKDRDGDRGGKPRPKPPGRKR